MACTRLVTKVIFCLRYKAFYHKKRIIFVAFGMLLSTSIALLHFVLLPSVSGAYNDDCYLDEKKLNEIRHLILVSAKLMEKYNMTYWLDYGSLLGAVKFGDVIPWDGDGDISSLYDISFDPKTMNDEFATHGINRNSLVAVVNGTQLDYVRWTTSDGVYNAHHEKMLNKYYPERILKNENIFVKFHHKRESLPLSWVVPPKKINFQGALVSVPNKYDKFLDARYPLTYRYNLFTPYKWKCWLPCWLTKDKHCRKYLKGH